MVPDGQKVWTDGWNGRTSSGDKKSMTQFSVLQTLLIAGCTSIVSIPINEPTAGF